MHHALNGCHLVAACLAGSIGQLRILIPFAKIAQRFQISNLFYQF
jgi:hypothetical protein